MTTGSLSIELNGRAFEPGETLRGTYRLVNADLSRLAEVEVTVGWHTEGEGLKDGGARAPRDSAGGRRLT